MAKKSIELEAGETIVFTIRRHWFMLVAEIALVVIVSLLPLFCYAAAYVILPPEIDLRLYTAHLIAFYALWLLIMWMTLFNIWTNYYLDTWTLTTKRFIMIDQRGFFFRNISSFRLERLQDVSVSINGIIPTFLKYGTVEIQTASEDGTFKMRGIANPEDIKSQILSISGSLQST